MSEMQNTSIIYDTGTKVNSTRIQDFSAVTSVAEKRQARIHKFDFEQIMVFFRMSSVFWPFDYSEFEICQIFSKCLSSTSKTKTTKLSDQRPTESMTFAVFRAVYICWNYLL